MANHDLPKDWHTSCIHFMIPLKPGKLSNYAPYNVNNYPEHVATLLHRAEDIHALVLLFGVHYAPQLSFDIDTFCAELSKRMKLKTSPRNWPTDPKQVAVCQLGTSSATFFSFVISVKALLDVMATVWVKIADSRAPAMTFNKSEIAGNKVAGGRLINWFRGSCPSTFGNRIKAATVLEKHSHEWITELVKYRDGFTHHGGVPGMTPLCLMLDLDHVESDEKGTFPRSEYSEQEVIKPKLPTGRFVADFVIVAGTRIQQMMREMASLFALDESLSSPEPPKPGDRWYIADERLEE